MGVAFYEVFADSDTVFVRHNGPETVYNVLTRVIPAAPQGL